MENNETLVKEMDNALENLVNAFYDLNSLWEKFQFHDNKVFSDFSNKEMTEDYPFKHSFDKECSYVRDWAEKLKDKLNGTQFKNVEFIMGIVRDINSLPDDERKDVLRAVNSIMGVCY